MPKREFVRVSASGSETYGALLGRLYAMTDFTKVSYHSKLRISNAYFHLYYVSAVSSAAGFSQCVTNITSSDKYMNINYINLYNNSCTYYLADARVSGNTTFSNYSTTKPSQGTAVSLYYN